VAVFNRKLTVSLSWGTRGLLLNTNGKLRRRFRLILKSATLNNLEMNGHYALGFRIRAIFSQPIMKCKLLRHGAISLRQQGFLVICCLSLSHSA